MSLPASRPPRHSAGSPARNPASLARTAALILPDFLQNMRETVQQGGVLDASQTNTFYYILWQGDGAMVARSPGAPDNVPAPTRVGPPEPQGLQARDAFGKGPPADARSRHAPRGAHPRPNAGGVSLSAARPVPSRRPLAGSRPGRHAAAGAVAYRRRGHRAAARPGRRLVGGHARHPAHRRDQRHRGENRRRRPVPAHQRRRHRQRTGPVGRRPELHLCPPGSRLCPAGAVHLRCLTRTAHARLGDPDPDPDRSLARAQQRRNTAKPWRPASAPPAA